MHLNVGAGEIIGDDRFVEDIEGTLARRRPTSDLANNHRERGVNFRRFARRSRPPLANNLGATNNIDVDTPENPLGSSLFGQSWTEAKILEIGPKLGSHLVDRLHRAAPQELTQPPH